MVMAAREPTLAALPNPFLRYLLATRPAFLTITFVGCVLGLATAHHSGITLDASLALLTVAFALVAHAGVNVVNDYYDALNGSDAQNTQRIFPFTGGSRFIQNGVLTQRETALFGFALLATVIPAGLWLTLHSETGLLVIGAAGLFIGWAYSAEPLKLNSRGLGELCVAIGFALIVIGTDFVQRKAFSATACNAALPYAWLVTAILYINQFPDRAADAAAGKRHWVVRLAPKQAAWGYALLVALAYGGLIVSIVLGHLPTVALAALATLPLSLRAQQQLVHYAESPSQLAPAIRLTLAAAHLHGLLLAGALFLTKDLNA
jgi:1,4-dihydroxy-2-naphthoate octaprenyltransferase